MKAWRKLGPTYVLLTMSLGILLIATLVFCCFGPLIVTFSWTHWAVTIPAAVNKQCFLTNTMKRSWNLVKGRTTTTFFPIVQVTLITLPMEVSATFIESLLGIPANVLPIVVGALSEGVIAPLIDVTRVVVFFELKTRKEGFDLEHRVNMLHGTPTE